MIDDAIADKIDSGYRQGSVEEIHRITTYITRSLYGISRGRQGDVVYYLLRTQPESPGESVTTAEEIR